MYKKELIILYIAIGLLIINIYMMMNTTIKIEGMSSTVNPEALANLASMYKNGELKVSKLEVTGDIIAGGKGKFGSTLEVKSNITAGGTGTFGNAKIGSRGNQAEFSHKSNFREKEKYGFVNDTGNTYINAQNGVFIKNRDKSNFDIPFGTFPTIHNSLRVKGNVHGNTLQADNYRDIITKNSKIALKSDANKYVSATAGNIGGWEKLSINFI